MYMCTHLKCGWCFLVDVPPFGQHIIEASLKYKPHSNSSRSQNLQKGIEAAASNTVLTVNELNTTSLRQ